MQLGQQLAHLTTPRRRLGITLGASPGQRGGWFTQPGHAGGDGGVEGVEPGTHLLRHGDQSDEPYPIAGGRIGSGQLGDQCGDPVRRHRKKLANTSSIVNHVLPVPGPVTFPSHRC
jgi:hypothetical protein